MNFVTVCLHCLDMRDFNSCLRKTPFLDSLRKKSIFIPMGRGHGHNQYDAILAELTGVWTQRYTNSEVSRKGFKEPDKFNLPKTLWERLEENGYTVNTTMNRVSKMGLGGNGGLTRVLEGDPNKERVNHFFNQGGHSLENYIKEAKESKGPFYSYFVIRNTHSPWDQEEELIKLSGLGKKEVHKDFKGNRVIWAARRGSSDVKQKFIEPRLEGLARTDKLLSEIFEGFSDCEDTAFVVYSNHGEMFDHYQGVQDIIQPDETKSPYGTTHGPSFPYEPLHANMQMWIIPGKEPQIMSGIGRSIDYTPTILDLADIEHEALDGESMLPYFEKNEFPQRDRYAEAKLAAGYVREDNMKVIFNGGFRGHQGRACVFDLTQDPWEYHDIADSPKGQQVIDWAIDRHNSLKQTQ